MNELLVLAACVSGACEPASKAYVKSHKGVQARMAYYEQKLGPVAPLAPILQKRVDLRYENSNLQLSEDSATLILTWRF